MSFHPTRWGLALILTGATLCPTTLAQDSEPAPPVEEPEAVAPADDPMMGGGMGAIEPASKQDMSYAIGFTIGSDMSSRKADMDSEELIKGIRAGLGEGECRLSDEQMQMALFSFQLQMQQKYQQAALDNLAKGQAYLAENAQKEGVKVTESGLQYKVIKSGDGPSPTIEDVVAVNYRGTLVDGSEFDSSPEGEPYPLPLGRLIPGWTEALLMMKVGDKWELTIPSDLGYAEQGSRDGAIGPNEVLIFEVELAEIVKE